MRDVVVIGGGLSGLAAAYELKRSNIAFTIIEVKPRLGGSIRSESSQGFILDAGDMVHQIEAKGYFTTFLCQVGLDGAVTRTPDGYLFNNGTGVLVEALTKTLSAPVMLRMAVSTLGWLDDGRCSICLENGMLLDARAVIVAVPARYAERLFYTLLPEVSELLLDYPYDPVVQVSLGYQNVDERSLSRPASETMGMLVQRTTHLTRVPKGSVLLHVDVRYNPSAGGAPKNPVAQVIEVMKWPDNPAASLVQIWPEARPMDWRQEAHVNKMKMIGGLLPPNVAICGSDYLVQKHAPTLDGRIRLGIEAARRVMNIL